MTQDGWETIMEAFKSSKRFGEFYEQVESISHSYLASFIWTHKRLIEKEYLSEAIDLS